MSIQAIGGSTAMADLTALAKSQTTNAPAKTSQPAAQQAGGTPPTGGAKGASLLSTATSSTSSTAEEDSSKIYDKRDADKDGVVSYQEELLYTVQHPTEETASASTVSTSQLQSGLSAYRQAQASSISTLLSAV